MDATLPVITRFRLHLGPSTEFTERSWGKRVKRIGGDYGRVTEGDTKRYVSVPSTPEGLALAAELIERFPGHERLRGQKVGTCVVLSVEGMHRDDWIGFPGAQGGGNVRYVRNDEPALPQLERTLRRYAANAETWWREMGEPAAKKRDEKNEERRQEQLRAWPAAIAAEVRKAIEAGVSREAIERALSHVITEKDLTRRVRVTWPSGVSDLGTVTLGHADDGEVLMITWDDGSFVSIELLEVDLRLNPAARLELLGRAS